MTGHDQAVARGRAPVCGPRRGRVWRALVAAAAATGGLAVGAGVVRAAEPVTETVPPPVPSTVPEPEPVVVAVGMPPVPPTTVVVAVGMPPVPPARDADGRPQQRDAAPAPADITDESSIAGAVASALAASALAGWQQS